MRLRQRYVATKTLETSAKTSANGEREKYIMSEANPCVSLYSDEAFKAELSRNIKHFVFSALFNRFISEFW